jgi:hypothetical protein
VVCKNVTSYRGKRRSVQAIAAAIKTTVGFTS